MSLNIDKCFVISLKQDTLNFNNVIYNTNLTRKIIIKDRGVLFNTKLSFSNRIDFICNKSFMKLGLLNYMSCDLSDSSDLKMLYYSLVCSHIMTMPLFGTLSSVQNNFFKYYSFKCNYKKQLYSGYNNILTFLNIIPFNSRFQMLNVKFNFKILYNFNLIEVDKINNIYKTY